MNSSDIIKESTRSLFYGENEYISKNDDYMSEFKNELDMEISVDCSELSAKASSSSMQESMTNISNSHSTPEDNFSENALMSPITKYPMKSDDIIKEIAASPPNQYYNGENDKVASSNQSIDDTIESVLNKYRNNHLLNKSSSFSTESKSKSNSHSNKSKAASIHSNIQSPAIMNTNNYPPSPYPVTYANGYPAYRGYYPVSQTIPVPYQVYNRPPSDSRYYYSYCPPPYAPYRPYYPPYAYSGQFYAPYPTPPSPGYAPYHPHHGQFRPSVIDEGAQPPPGYANFKIPHSSANITASTEQSSISKKKRHHDSKTPSNSKRRKTSHSNKNSSNIYEEILAKLNARHPASLIMGPQMISSLVLFPPVGYVNENVHFSPNKTIHSQKYKSHIYYLTHDKKSLDIKPDKYLKKFVEEPPPKLLRVNKVNHDKEGSLDISPPSPTTKASRDNLLKNVSFVIPSISELVRTKSPEIAKFEPKLSATPVVPSASFRLSDNHQTPDIPSNIPQNDFKIPESSSTENEMKIIREQIDKKDSIGECHAQLNGTYLKRSKINGKMFSNVHIEEVINVPSIINMKTVTCCSKCSSLLNSNNIIKKDVELCLESENDEFSFCTMACFDNFKRICVNNPKSIDRAIVLNPVKLEQSQVILCPTSMKSAKLTPKKTFDFEQYVRRRFPSENSDSCSKISQLDVKYRYREIKYFLYCSEKIKPLPKSVTKKDQSFILSMYSKYFGYSSNLVDERSCMLCKSVGDADENLCGRLMNIDLDNWIHMNCALWCFEVYETLSGGLMEVAPSIEKALKTPCSYCNELGAGIQCYRSKCRAIYHVPCAHKIGSVFYSDRGMYCPQHAIHNHELVMTTLYAADRRVVVYRDENELIASSQSFIGTPDDKMKPIFRTGSLILNNIGQLLPEQLRSGRYNSSSIIYPIGFHTTRIYWSFNHIDRRCRYECHIIEKDNAPAFKLCVIDHDGSQFKFIETGCDKVWQIVLNKIAKLRIGTGVTKLFPFSLTGEQLFGLTEPNIIRVIESLPGVDMIPNYAFKFGKMQLISEMPLVVNPSGSARTEPKLRTYVRQRQIFNPIEESYNNSNTNLSQCSILKTKQLFNPQLDSLSKFQSQSSRLLQYKKMKSEWMDNVILSRSKIQGLGLFAAQDFEKSQIIIEYIGELIRNEVGNRREKAYEARNDSIYMFRLNEDTIIDATRNGGLARYINHSCSPNCVAELLQTDSGDCIVITTKQKILRGEELSYDYKFDFEEDLGSARIPCLCGSPNCRKWMN